MDNLKALGRGTQLMFISAVLLLIISFFHWQEVDFGPVSAGQSAWHGFWGVVMGILTIVLVARIAARLAAVDVPIPLSFATTSFVLGILIALCAILKVITDDYTKFWAYIGVVLAILIAVGAWLEVQEAGGMEHLRSQATSLGGAAGGAAGAGAAPTTPEPPAAAPAAPEPPPSAPADTSSGAMSGGGEAAGEAASDAGDAASAAADAAEGAAGEAAGDVTDGPSTGGGA